VKSIRMLTDYNFRAGRQVWIKFIGGVVYHRVTEAAARAIVQAGAGKIVLAGEDENV
jgi:hypothetical protein